MWLDERSFLVWLIEKFQLIDCSWEKYDYGENISQRIYSMVIIYKCCIIRNFIELKSVVKYYVLWKIKMVIKNWFRFGFVIFVCVCYVIGGG